jgi:hypothetical protein
LTWSFSALVRFFAGLAELRKEFMYATGNGLVALDLTGPVAFDGVLDESLLPG